MPLRSRPDSASWADQSVPVQNCQAAANPPAGTRATWANLMAPANSVP
jgi:hypothetical protein